MHNLLSICANPSLVGILREEIEEALVQDGGWQKSTASKLNKLDSVMRETQRLNPPGISESRSSRAIAQIVKSNAQQYHSAVKFSNL